MQQNLYRTITCTLPWIPRWFSHRWNPETLASCHLPAMQQQTTYVFMNSPER